MSNLMANEAQVKINYEIDVVTILFKSGVIIIKTKLLFCSCGLLFPT